MGHYCPLNGNNLDDYLDKAIELNCPNKLIPILTNHRALLYYPNPSLIEKVFKLHHTNKDWASMKAFYTAIGRKYYIKKTDSIYKIFIENAFSNKDHEMCVNAFLDILDYEETTLDADTYRKIIYSNANLVKDKIFVELLEKSLKTSKVESFGIILPLLYFNISHKNTEKVNYFIQKLEHAIISSNTEVYSSTFMVEFLNSIISTEEDKTLLRVKEIIKKLQSESVFDNSYKELIDKIKQ